MSFIQNEDDYKIKDINWPKIGEFNEKIAIEKIDEFIKKVILSIIEIVLFLCFKWKAIKFFMTVFSVLLFSEPLKQWLN